MKICEKWIRIIIIIIIIKHIELNIFLNISYRVLGSTIKRALISSMIPHSLSFSKYSYINNQSFHTSCKQASQQENGCIIKWYIFPLKKIIGADLECGHPANKSLRFFRQTTARYVSTSNESIHPFIHSFIHYIINKSNNKNSAN